MCERLRALFPLFAYAHCVPFGREPDVPLLSYADARIVDALTQPSNSEGATAPASAEQRLAALQKTLRCGTDCGSCVPELKALVRRHQPLQHVEP